MKTKACRELDLFTLLADGRGRIYFFYLSSSLGKSLARDWMSPEVDDITWSRWHHLRWMALLEVDDVTWVGRCHLSWMMSLELDEVTWGDDIIWGRRYHLRWLVSPEVDDVTWGRWFHLKWTISPEVGDITCLGWCHLRQLEFTSHGSIWKGSVTSKGRLDLLSSSKLGLSFWPLHGCLL